MKEFLSIREVAEYLGVDYKTIYRLVQGGEMPAGKVGGVYRIRSQDVEDYFRRQQQVQAQEAARATAPIKCGRCLRLLAPYEIEGTCEAPDCEEPICAKCWQEDPNHRCRDHALSRDALLRQAQAQLAQGQVLLVLGSDDAHRREFLYISRVSAKLQQTAEIRNPLTGRSLRVSDWGSVETRVKELDRFRQAMAGYLDESVTSLLPTNPRHTYRLARGLWLEVAVYSDLATHLKQGFVTQPTGHTELFDLLGRAIERSEEEDSLLILGLAATAGWGDDAVALILGNAPAQRPFFHRLVAPVLVDLAGDRLVYNPVDERLGSLAPLFSPELTMDVIQGLMAAVEALFQGGRTSVLLSDIVERSGASPALVADALDRLAATRGYQVKEVDKTDRLILRRSA
jgi:excisionase family DNA binding protein